MSQAATIGVVVTVVVVLLLVALALFARNQMRSRHLRSRFGPEYDRLVQDRGSRREAEHELMERESRVRSFELRPLDSAERKRYAGQWLEVQERFVDDPAGCVASAQDLVTSLMRDRGYPTEDTDQRMADLSVQHAGVVDNYRSAHELSHKSAAGEANTEDLRQAMVHYRALFAELLEEHPGHVRPGG